MDLSRALRISPSARWVGVVSLVGAGGKTTAMFQLARELIKSQSPSVILTATSHLGAWQTSQADHHLIAVDLSDLKDIPSHGITLVTGGIENERTKPVDQTTLNWLREYTKEHNIPLLIEADGSRQKPLKAPAAYEPPIPEFTDTVLVVAGLGALGKPLTDEFVHRSEIYSQLSGLQMNQPVTPDALITCSHPPKGRAKEYSICRAPYHFA